MATITIKGNPVHTCGDLPAVGTPAPQFVLTGSNLQSGALSELQGKWVILNIFPSVDTPTCATSVKEFNRRVTDLIGTVVVCISADLPFAHKRFCLTEDTNRVVMMSNFRDREFGESYGILMTDGPLEDLLARAIVIIDPEGIVRYTQLVPELTQEPDYDAALATL